jgi:hypothetical protein
MKTEGDIPGLFRQFSGNSANYQELTRAAAARASQARWPLLSAVELEQGHIPAVGSPEPDILESAASTSAALPSAADRDAHRIRGLTRLAGLAAREQTTQVDADDAPATPAPVVRPGNTIFMPPAPHTARHFAQIERNLAERADTAHSLMGVHAALSIDETPALAAHPSIAATRPAEPAVDAGPIPFAKHAADATHAQPGRPVAVLSQIGAVAAPEATLPDAASGAVKHAGLKPLFDRLAGNDHDKASVESLFTRLMRS